MQSPVAAIRAASSRASFVRASGRQRERHLGLRGGALPRLIPAARTPVSGRLAALRGSGLLPEEPRPRSSPLRRSPQVRWTGSLPLAERGAVAHRATPWRG